MHSETKDFTPALFVVVEVTKGLFVGAADREGVELGVPEGAEVGAAVGVALGEEVGAGVGAEEGLLEVVGDDEGARVGAEDGRVDRVGAAEGAMLVVGAAEIVGDGVSFLLFEVSFL